MELPTYTSIWRIEKRLYKLYDFRLPMPLPVGQIAVFTAITVPYIVLLTVFGLPFNHNLFWLYVLPPGLLTWLATRPVLESKRLPELLTSQARYLGEPRIWCRMAPLAEKDDVVIFGRVWRRASRAERDVLEPTAGQLPVTARSARPVAGQVRRPIAAPSAQRAGQQGELPRARRARAIAPARPRGVADPAGHPEGAHDPGPARPVRARGTAAPVGYPEAGWEARAAGQVSARGTAAPAGYPQVAHDPGPAGRVPARGAAAAPVGYPEVPRHPGPASRPQPKGPSGQAGHPPAKGAAGQAEPVQARGTAGPAAPLAARRDVKPAGPPEAKPAGPPEVAHELRPARQPAAPSTSGSARGTPGSTRAAPGPAQGPTAPAPRSAPPVRLVPAQRSVAGPLPARPAPPRPAPVERVLSGPGEQRAAGWRSHVTVVPGGRGPGRPDHEKEAKARAVLPLAGPRLVVVLGCTVGAGQTMTTLILADLLASLRGEPVAALDLNPGPASLTELSRAPAATVSTILARPPGAHAASAASAAHRGQAGSRGSRGRGRLDVICQDAAAGTAGTATGIQGAPASLQHSRLLDILASRYLLTLADPGSSAVAKVLPAADQLVLVAPASADAARAVSMTCEWLGGHGHGALAAHSIAVINGVSRRSVRHAEQAELVLRGRCRAIVRVPWDDHLAEPEAERGIRDSLDAAGGPSRLGRLHPAVLQAYTALAGVLVSALAADPARRRAAR